MSQLNEGIKTFTAGEDLLERCRVKQSSTAGQVEYADSDDQYIGITEYGVSSGERVAVRMRTQSGTVKVTAAGAFSIGDELWPADDGQVDDSLNGDAEFIALEAATAADDIVEAVVVPKAWAGEWNDSGVVAHGVALSSTRQFAQTVAGDDGGTALTAGWYGATLSHMLIDTTFTDGRNVSAFGACGELHLGVNITPGGNQAGMYAYAEIETGITLTNPNNISFSALLAGIDVPSGAVIGTGGIVSGICVGGNLGGTHTGKAVVLQITNPGAGAFDYFMQVGRTVTADTTGCVETTFAGNAANQVRALKVRVCATDYWIPLQNATS